MEEKEGGSGGKPWASGLLPSIQLLFVSNWFNFLLAIFTTYRPSCFKTSLRFPCTILSKSCCLTELPHIHFSCCSMFTKTKDWFQHKILLCLFPSPELVYFCYKYISSFISCQVDNILATKQFTITQAKHSDTCLWMDLVYNFKKKKSHQRHCFILSMSKIQVYLKPRQETLVKSGIGMI